MSWLRTVLKDVEGFFTSTKVEVFEKDVVSLMPYALKVVQEINTVASNRTLAEINTICTTYALPAFTSLETGVANIGNVLLNLATQILAKQKPSAAVSTLNTVVQLAVSAVKNK